VHQGINQVPTTRETLENLEIISQVTQQPIADIDIIVPTTKNPNHYLKLVKNHHLEMLSVVALVLILRILSFALHFLIAKAPS
jgi:hypothetical protein